MAVAFNGSTGYLQLASAVRAALPCSIVFWSNKTAADVVYAHAQQYQNSDPTNYASSYYYLAAGKIADIHNVGGQGKAIKATTPDPSNTTLQMGIAAFAANSVWIYYGSSTAQQDTTAFGDTTSNFDRTDIGRAMGVGSLRYHLGDLAEVHFFNRVLDGTDWTTMAGGTLPETQSGWVDGWTLVDSSSLVSIGGTRTLTLNGGVTNSSATHPYSRGGGAAFTPNKRKLLLGAG